MNCAVAVARGSSDLAANASHFARANCVHEHDYHWYANRHIAGIGKLDEARIAEQISALRGSLPNPTFIVFPHWGVDYEGITSKHRLTAAALADAGADLIIGHGAHVVQDVEMINGCLVIYNIGNFVWNTPGRFSKCGAPPYGLAAALNFGSDPDKGVGLRLYPIVTDNALTDFQNRLVTSVEFVDALEVLPLGPHGLLRPTQDATGFHVELTLSRPRPSEEVAVDLDSREAPGVMPSEAKLHAASQRLAPLFSSNRR